MFTFNLNMWPKCSEIQQKIKFIYNRTLEIMQTHHKWQQIKEDLRMLLVGYLAIKLEDRMQTNHFKGKFTHYLAKTFQM